MLTTLQNNLVVCLTAIQRAVNAEADTRRQLVLAILEDDLSDLILESAQLSNSSDSITEENYQGFQIRCETVLEEAICALRQFTTPSNLLSAR